LTSNSHRCSFEMWPEALEALKVLQVDKVVETVPSRPKPWSAF
jgi:hypothetical protein